MRPLVQAVFFSARFARTTTCITSAKAFSSRQANQNHRNVESTNTVNLTTKVGQPFDRPVLDNLLRRNLFYTPSFEIYSGVGGLSGLYDYGPPGCALQANVIDSWRKHFILEESMLEVDCTVLTPEAVLETSGHVERFADFICTDSVNGDVFRADHLVKQFLEAKLKANEVARRQSSKGGGTIDTGKQALAEKSQMLDDTAARNIEKLIARIDNVGGEELDQLIKQYGIKSPSTGAELSPPKPFNLMFQTQIGPTAGRLNAYLRPETAQGQFVNFRKLLNFNRGRMPFASASIGKSFRNEIAPASGLLRVREFLMAEIEHFVDPESGKRHPCFEEVENTNIALLNRTTQLSGSTKPDILTIGEAVSTKVVDNETLGYFLVRIQDFLLKLGIDKSKLRFRQHMANEMAHYATDCWDAEILTSSGWIECVGCADRAAYDLTVHSNKTGDSLVAQKQRTEPLVVKEYQTNLNLKNFGRKFRKDAKAVETAVRTLTQESLKELSVELSTTGKITIDTPGIGNGETELENDVLQIEQTTRLDHIREYTPSVIEPSFGIGRILHSLTEHVYWARQSDERRAVLSFPIAIAPTKVVILPQSHKTTDDLVAHQMTFKLAQRLRRLGISNNIDSSAITLGKRYVRNDELGTPLALTIDMQSPKDETVTLRDRDSLEQVRGSIDDVVQAIKNMVDGEETWPDIRKRLPVFEANKSDDEVD